MDKWISYTKSWSSIFLGWLELPFSKTEALKLGPPGTTSGCIAAPGATSVTRVSPWRNPVGPIWFLRSWGYPNSWMVFVMENPNLNWMIWGYPHGFGNLHTENDWFRRSVRVVIDKTKPPETHLPSGQPTCFPTQIHPLIHHSQGFEGTGKHGQS